MFDILKGVPYLTFQARPDAVAGRCALRHCSEQFNTSAGFSLYPADTKSGRWGVGGASGNIIAVGNQGTWCE